MHPTSNLTATSRRITSIAILAAVAALAGCSGGDSDGSVQVPAGDSTEYIAYLEENSMLYQAARVAEPISGSGTQWREEFGEPKPAEMREIAAVWLMRYPLATIPMDGESVISTWADPEFWTAAGEVGIRMLRTNPTQRSGGIEDREFTPTIDGYFDRIGFDTDPDLGTDE